MINAIIFLNDDSEQHIADSHGFENNHGHTTNQNLFFLLSVSAPKPLFPGKKIYLSENSLKFISECLMNYDKIKDNKYKFNEKSKYNSYPNFSEIIRYRFKKF